MYDLIIIGAGPAGAAAAIYAGRKKLKTAIISIDLGGQVNLTAHIENYPGARPLPGIKLMEIFQEQIKQSGAELIFGKVTKVKKIKNGFEVILADGEKQTAKSLILAFGKTPRKLGIPGEDKFFGKGVSTCATCDGPLFKNKVVGVVGGGNSALEAALELSKIAQKVYLIHRRKDFRADEVTVEKVKAAPKIELVLDSTPIEIKGEKFVQAAVIENSLTRQKKELALAGLFLEIGYEVDSSLVKELVETNKMNEVIADAAGRTSDPAIFAAGDVTSTPFKQAIIAAGDGARAAMQAYMYLTQGSAIIPDWKHETKK